MKLQGSMPLQAVPVPNPSRPSTHYVRAGELDAVHHPSVKRDLAESYPPVVHGGVNVNVVVTRPPEGTTIKAYRSIYDIAGNLVISGSCDDVMGAYRDSIGTDVPSTKVSLYMHWNGFNAQGKPVAPGGLSGGAAAGLHRLG